LQGKAVMYKVLVAGKTITTLQRKAVVSKGLRGWYYSQKNCKTEAFSEKVIKLLIKFIADMTTVYK
jgi:hypothetical protein